MKNKDWLDAAMDLMLTEHQRIGTMYFLMSEDNVKLQLKQPWMKFGTDAGGPDPDSARRSTHPRTYGNFPRILGKYVRDEHVMPLEDAIRKMTSAVADAAARFATAACCARDVRRRRGLRSGDDPRARTYEKPKQLSPVCARCS